MIDLSMIKGSFTQATVANIYTTATAISVLPVYSAPTMAMDQLSPLLNSVLAASPVVASMIVQIPMARFVETNGGKKQVLILMSGSLVGMSAVTVLSLFKDITLINRFDWQYTIMLASGCLLGSGSGAYGLVINTIEWAKDENQRDMIQPIFGAIADVSGVIAPIVIYLLKPYGYALSFGVFTALVASGLGVAARFVVPTPYHQLVAQCSHEEARELAIQAGQMPDAIHEVENKNLIAEVRDYWHALASMRGATLNFSFFTSLGGYFVTATILPTLLRNGFHASELEAILTSSLANFVTVAARVPTVSVIKKWDANTNGVYVHDIACAFTIGAAIPLAFFETPRWLLYPCIGVLNATWGATMSTTIQLNFPWKRPANESLNEYNPNLMLGMLGMIGTAGGLILPLCAGVLADVEGDVGYKHYFGLIMGLALISAVLVSLTHLSVNNTSGMSLLGKAFNLFKSKRYVEQVDEVRVEEMNEVQQGRATVAPC